MKILRNKLQETIRRLAEQTRYENERNFTNEREFS